MPPERETLLGDSGCASSPEIGTSSWQETWRYTSSPSFSSKNKVDVGKAEGETSSDVSKSSTCTAIFGLLFGSTTSMLPAPLSPVEVDEMLAGVAADMATPVGLIFDAKSSRDLQLASSNDSFFGDSDDCPSVEVRSATLPSLSQFLPHGSDTSSSLEIVTPTDPVDA
jgi:hypothetical protein